MLYSTWQCLNIYVRHDCICDHVRSNYSLTNCGILKINTFIQTLKLNKTVSLISAQFTHHQIHSTVLPKINFTVFFGKKFTENVILLFSNILSY